jgi:hypothetical protein
MKKIIDRVRLRFNTKIIDIDIKYPKDSYVFELLTGEAKLRIYQELDSMHDSDKLESENLTIEKAEVFDDLNAIAQRIYDEIDIDYQQNRNESAEGGFNFKYLLTETDIEPAALRVTVEISDPVKRRGNVFYSLTIKKQNGKYYLWPFED